MVKDQIKAWLKATHRDRDWLGSQVGVEKKTVDNWLSSAKTIPPSKLKLIERLMETDAADEARRKQQLDPVNQVFSVEVDLPTFRAYSQAALNDAKTLEQWTIDELNKAAEEYFRTHPSRDYHAASQRSLAQGRAIVLNEGDLETMSADQLEALLQQVTPEQLQAELKHMTPDERERATRLLAQGAPVTPGKAPK